LKGVAKQNIEGVQRKLYRVYKTRHPLLTIISLNLNRFSKFFHWWKACKISNKTLLNLWHYPSPQLKYIAALWYIVKLKCSNLLQFVVSHKKRDNQLRCYEIKTASLLSAF